MVDLAVGRHVVAEVSIEIDYAALVRDPQSIVSRLVQFLGPEQLPNETVMAAVVDPLHRQKR